MDAAFVGTFSQANPTILGGTVALGGTVPGFCPRLWPLFGATSFDPFPDEMIGSANEVESVPPDLGIKKRAARRS